MSHSTVRLGNGELDAVTELHRVNLSPENRFEASPLRGNSTATGTGAVGAGDAQARFAFIFGVLPLTVAVGAGAEMRQSLGTAVFAGMIGVTLFGLLFTPTFYVFVRALPARLTGTWHWIVGSRRGYAR